uniref:Chloride channel protein n=1 Tax=Cacopsylla melanoneura TaxID=428564 RepID=A0A8D9BGM1_9HEMI
MGEDKMENEGPVVEKSFRQFSSKYETIDLDRHETEMTSESLLESLRSHNHVYVTIMRWILVFLTGVLVSVLMCIVRVFRIVLICYYVKPALLRAITSDFPHNLELTYAVWIAFYVVCIFIATALCVFIEPEAGGNDIVGMTAFFNGILIKNLLTLKTALVMYFSMMAQIPGGVGGTEIGPMIKISATVGYLLPKIYFPFRFMIILREEKERRNLALCGMAAGMASTLNAPVAGALIAVENTTNNFNTSLFQQVFFCSWVAKIFSRFALTLIYNFYLNDQWIDNQRLPTFGLIDNSKVHYHNFEFVLYILVGVCGGVLGCLWKELTLRVSKIRGYLSADGGTKTCLLMEGILWPAIIAWFHISLLYLFRSEPCVSTTQLLMDEIKSITVTSPKDFFNMPSLTCSNNTEMPQAGIALIFPNHIVTYLVHSLPKTFSLVFLASLFIFIYFQSAITAGMCMCSGLFIYHIILGTLWGRILGEYLHSHVREQWCDPNKIALLGAAAQLSGVFHYRLVTVAALIESTGSYQAYTIPLLITTVVARSVAHMVSPHSYYEMIIKYNGMPFLSPNIPYNDTTPVTEIMAHPIIQVPSITTVGTIMDVLSKNKGRYPVIADNGVLLGDASRNYLCSILLNKVQDLKQPVRFAAFKPILPKLWDVECTIEYYEKAMQTLRANLTVFDLVKEIHLVSFYNNSFHVIKPETNATGAYTFFQQTGVHTMYVTKQGRCLGVITRKDVIEAKDKNKKTNKG